MQIFVAIWSKTTRNLESKDLRQAGLEAAVHKAWMKFQANNKGKGEIKAIFLAPEYFMTAPRANMVDAKALLEDDRDKMVRDLCRVSQKLPDMMLVPGTIAFQKELQRSGSQKNKRNAEGERTGALKTTSRTDKAMQKFDTVWPQLDFADKRFDGVPGASMEKLKTRKANFAFDVQVAGPLLGPPPKIFKNNAYVFLNGQIVHKYSKQADFFETLGAPGVHFIPGGRCCTQEIKGIRFGFEICMDHAMQMLGSSTAAYAARSLKALGTPPDIHIVLSDWVDNKYFPMRNGGFMLHASTNPTCSTVFYKDLKGRVEMVKENDDLISFFPIDRKLEEKNPFAEFLGEEALSGGPLRCYTINLN